MRIRFGLAAGLLAVLTTGSASDPVPPDPQRPQLAPIEPISWRGMYPNQQPTPPTSPPKAPGHANQLKADIEALRAARKDATPSVGSDTTAERDLLRAKVKGLLLRLEAKSLPPDPPTQPMVAPAPKPVKITPTDSGKPIDQLSEAINLFRANDLVGAERAVRDLESAKLSREERAHSQYLLGCCLRRTNRLSEAATIFREVANARDDELAADAAITQLSLIRSTQELETLLEQLRTRPKQR